jgi:hypothetical protein
LTASGSRLLGRAAVLLAVAAAATAWRPGVTAAGVFPGSVTVRAEGRAPVLGGRVDTAYRQALDEAFRRALLEALRGIAPERQSPHDLETWQSTVLSRAADFVGAWRILGQREHDGFLTLETEVEIWREKLARAALASGPAAAAAAVRVLVLAGSFPLVDPAADEEVDAGRIAVSALEAELARRGAVIVAAADRAPWESASGPSSEENRVALAAAAAKRYDADAVLIAQLAPRGEGLSLAAQLVASASETTLVSARAVIDLPRDRPLSESFAPAARQLAVACAPHLSAARSGRGRAPLP